MDSKKNADIARLSAELENAQEQVAELEEKLASLKGEEYLRREDRKPLEADIEFIGDFDVVCAKGIDLSDGGICFELEDPLYFDMKFEIEGEEYRRGAHMVWMRSLDSGNYRVGLQFTSEVPEPDF